MQRIAPLNACGVVAKCVLNTLIIGANLVALGMLVVRGYIDECE
jgi:hypothetical protein